MPDHTESEAQMESEQPTVQDRPVLLAAVIIMGVLLVIGFVLVFGTIIYRLSSGGDEETVRLERGQFGQVDVSVAGGTSLLGTTFIEDRLAILTNHEGTAEVIIVDTKRGLELGRVRLVAEGQGAVSTPVAPPPAE